MTKSILIIAVIIFGAIISINAQEIDSTLNRPIQLSFVYPLGTNGLEAYNYTNKVSLNWLAGFNGGVEGIEAAGLVNVLKYDMNGCQFAGIGNTVFGSSQGAQFAGIFNVTLKKADGLQMAGIVNYATRSSITAQFAGIANSIIDTVNGIQAAGIVNFSLGIDNGAQLAGIANSSFGNTQGGQVAGIVNLTGGTTTGSQIAGIANLSTDSLQGIQIAGITNICASYTKGTQISGIANVCKTLNGLQLGFINYADSIEKGIPIGFISIVRKNGYKAIEVSANETMYANVSLKTGVNKFYNIFTAGLKTENSDMIWGFGYGLGTLIPLNKKMNINFDITANSMHYNSAWTNHLNLLNKLSMSVEYRINKHIAVFAGASFNIHISNMLDNTGEKIDQIPVPYNTAEFSSNNTLLRMYPGISFGIRL